MAGLIANCQVMPAAQAYTIAIRMTQHSITNNRTLLP